jgi:hypothetical protein
MAVQPRVSELQTDRRLLLGYSFDTD